MSELREIALPMLSTLPFSPKLWQDATPHARASRLHGPDHWERVARNGLNVGWRAGADLSVVLAFALIHDAFRINDEGSDVDHGRRAAAWAIENEVALGLTRRQNSHLRGALADHADGWATTDSTASGRTIGACWDADRLDLPRIGIVPDPKLLSTEWAREHARGVRERMAWRAT